MKKIGLVGLALAVPAGLVAIDSGRAADSPTKSYGKDSVNCRAPDAPYKNYDCLDKYLGDGFFERMVNYYRLEWGHRLGSVRSQGAAVAARGLAGATADHAADAVHRMALWRRHLHRR